MCKLFVKQFLHKLSQFHVNIYTRMVTVLLEKMHTNTPIIYGSFIDKRKNELYMKHMIIYKKTLQ